MNIHDVAACSATPTPPRHPPLALAERVAAARAASPCAPAAAADGDVGSSPMQDSTRAWALRHFKETLFYGDEEENGIPPLSIDI